MNSHGGATASTRPSASRAAFARNTGITWSKAEASVATQGAERLRTKTISEPSSPMMSSR